MQKNFDSLHEFLCSLQIRPKIICLSESRINHKPFINIELPDYKFVHIDSPTSAGGVAVYISSELRFNILFNLSLDIDGCENIWIKLCHSDLLLGVIYRHPRSNVKLFTDQLNKTLEQLKNSKVYLIGDMNINLSPIFDVSNNNSNVNSTNEFVNMLASNGYFPLITLPTRVTTVSPSIIDHIITNDHKNIIFPGIIKSDLTDHYPIFCFIDAVTCSNKTNLKIFRRDFANFNSSEFCDDLHDALSAFFQQNKELNDYNFNHRFRDFIEIVKSKIDKHAPLKKLTRKQRKLKCKPWITRGILTSIKHKQKLYISHFIKGDTGRQNVYKKYANKLTKIKFISKQMYYQEELNKSKNNAFKTWSVIKSLFSCSQNSSEQPELINHKGKVLTDSQTISDSFNAYFSTIGPDLTTKFNGQETNAYLKFLSTSNISSLFISTCTENDVIQHINSLKNNNSSGSDEISSRFLILAAEVLATPLKILFNYSGIFPDCLKTAKVIPIYKQGDKTDIGNYRHISILSSFSKILEKVICKRTHSFLDKHSILLPTQYGFRPAQSTTHAMLDIFTSSLDNLNLNKNTALLLLDLKKLLIL